MLGQRIGLLEALPIFKGLSKGQLALILDVSVKAYFETGDYLVTRNYPGDTAYLIMSGAARCLDFPGEPQAGQHVDAGCLIGETAMLVETVYPVTIEAKTRVRALAFEREAMKWAMESDPAIAERISDNLAARLYKFAADMRRLDNFLDHVERNAPAMYSIPGLLRPQPASAEVLQAAKVV
jgi:CRP/FNR family transcriptional regulator, cyclic AMP receptor protein